MPPWSSGLAKERSPKEPFKRRLFRVLGRNLHFLSRFCLAAAFCWTLALPFACTRGQYFDENALLGYNTPVSFSDVAFPRQLRDHARSLANRDILNWVRDTAHAWGLPAHRYDFPQPGGSSEGTNVVVTVPSPRGSGGEALLVVVPLSHSNKSDGDNGAATNVALALALMRHIVDAAWLSHDVVWLFAWPGSGAPHYARVLSGAGLTPDMFVGPVPHEVVPTGVVRAAICLALDTYHFQRFLEVNVEGINGELPNQDVMFAAHVLVQAENLVPTHGHRVPFQGGQGPVLNALRGLAALFKPQPSPPELEDHVVGLARHIVTVATGLPGGAHAAFRRSGIHGVSLHNNRHARVSEGDGGLEERNLRAVGRIVEGFLRCMNNLSEQLHASFFIYFVASHSHFVSFDIVNLLTWTGIVAIGLDTLWLYYGVPSRASASAPSAAAIAPLREYLGAALTATAALSLGAVVYGLPLALAAVATLSPMTQVGLALLLWGPCACAFYALDRKPLLAAARRLGLDLLVAPTSAPASAPSSAPHDNAPDSALAPGTADDTGLDKSKEKALQLPPRQLHRLRARCLLQVLTSACLTSLTVWNPPLCLLSALYIGLLCVLGTPPALLYPEALRASAQRVHVALLLATSPVVAAAALVAAWGPPQAPPGDWLQGAVLCSNLLYITLALGAFPLWVVHMGVLVGPSK